jgi:nitroreductase
MTTQIDTIRNALAWRYATKSFDSRRKIPPEEWSLLEDALVLAPSSYGLQPWQFLVVENVELRVKLRAVSWNQSQVTDASHLLVFTTLKDISAEYVKEFIQRNMEVRDVAHDALAGYENMMLKNIVEGMDKNYIRTWNHRQAYIAMGFLLETAALLNVDTVAMEGLDPRAYDRILGLEGGAYETVAAVALGYRTTEDKYQFAKKVRFSKERMIKVLR